MPLAPIISFTKAWVETASDGYKTVESKGVRNIARSSSPICDSPSLPIEAPPYEPFTKIFAPERSAMRIWSWTRERKQAKVETNGLNPTNESPQATQNIFCSAIKH